MKPRVMFATRNLRLVRTAKHWFVVEQPDGKDAMGRTRWARVENEALREKAVAFVDGPAGGVRG